MKILNTAQIRLADQYTIKHEPIPSIDLMERASMAFIQWFTAHFQKTQKVHIVCGPGNNGGDGLAIGRLLIHSGWKVTVAVAGAEEYRTADFRVNYHLLSEICSISEIVAGEDIRLDFEAQDIIIDALFGSGLSRPLEGIFATLISAMHASGSIIVSVDIPSGLYSNQPSNSDAIVKADYVVSFQTPKLAFLLPENSLYVRNWVVLNIGLNEAFIESQHSDFEYMDEKTVKGLIKSRNRFAHKTDHGRILLICGSYGKMGAAVLCAKACIGSGAGLVTTHIPSCGYNILQIAAPEIMVTVDPFEQHISQCPDISTYDTIAIGPGIGTIPETRRVLKTLLSNHRRPLVIDADALNMIALEPELINLVPENSILTPHPGEFRRLVGDWENDYDRLAKQQQLSIMHKIIVVLKGAHTSISSQEGKVNFNSTGNPGMATAGSGDVLTGIISSLLGQRYSPLEAAQLGVYLHGLAGDIGVAIKTEECLIASDIIHFLPDAFKVVREDKTNL